VGGVVTDPSCPICGGIPTRPAFPYETIWNGKTFRYRRCDDCNTTSVDPVPNEVELETIYAWNNYHRRHFGRRDDLGRHRDSMSFLRTQLPAARTLLDFGCGDGSYLVAARESGYRAHGVEYELGTIKHAAECSGVPVTSLEELEANELRFDVIHMNDVLPHLSDPQRVLHRLERLLAPDGLFFIEGPLENNASLVFWTASAAKRIRRGLGLDRPGSEPPTMLMRLTRDGQCRFFSERMQYRELHFEIFETGWPYYLPGRALSSPALAMKQAVGALAIATARFQPQRRRFLGNRFRGLYAPAHRG
jgi:2-polyprenyl-3-methyl-5-hydroxy-6-metoxy-1,4-benzoquinol methylase